MAICHMIRTIEMLVHLLWRSRQSCDEHSPDHIHIEGKRSVMRANVVIIYKNCKINTRIM